MCVTSPEACASPVRHTRGHGRSAISVPAWPLAAAWELGEANVSLWLTQGGGKKWKPDNRHGQGQDRAARIKSKCVRGTFLARMICDGFVTSICCCEHVCFCLQSAFTWSRKPVFSSSCLSFTLTRLSHSPPLTPLVTRCVGPPHQGERKLSNSTQL